MNILFVSEKNHFQNTFRMDELFVKDGRPIPGLVLRKESYSNLSTFTVFCHYAQIEWKILKMYY